MTRGVGGGWVSGRPAEEAERPALTEAVARWCRAPRDTGAPPTGAPQAYGAKRLLGSAFLKKDLSFQQTHHPKRPHCSVIVSLLKHLYELRKWQGTKWIRLPSCSRLTSHTHTHTLHQNTSSRRRIIYRRANIYKHILEEHMSLQLHDGIKK